MAAEHLVFNRPDWTRPRLAPAGDRFAAVRRLEGAANVWIGSSTAPMQLASDLGPWRLHDYHWGADGTGLLLELQFPGTDRRVLAWLDLRARNLTRLTPGSGADARYAGQVTSPRLSLLIAVRYKGAQGSRLQQVTPGGAVLAEWQPPGEPATRWLASDGQAIAVVAGQDGCTWWHSELASPSWSPVLRLPAADCSVSRPVAFSADGRSLFALSSAGRDTLALVRMSPPSWTQEVLSAADRNDIVAVLMAPDRGGPDLVTTTDPAAPQTALSSEAKADLARLDQIADGALTTIIGRNASHCLAEVAFDVGGPAFVTFSRTSEAVSKPLPRFSAFSQVRMQRRDPFSFRARDGLLVTGFITRPSGPPPWPAVLVMHDGPWSRDLAQMDPWAQFLAAAGLCCVQVNFRGSRGFGKSFRDAGDKQWSLAMQDDLIDAIRSADVAAVTDPGRIGAIGYGYGGYAALMLATQTEVPIACVVSASAPTDLIRYVTGLVSSGGPAGLAEAARIGDPVADRDRLVRASPVYRAGETGPPVLLFHGRQDTQVPVSHATSLAEALHQEERSCTLTVYADEGHQYLRPQNVVDLRERTMEFLRRSLTGPAHVSGGPG
jgi:dienelactone hydrolase